MLLKETLEILQKILEQTDLTEVLVTETRDPVHIEYDTETLEPKEDQDLPDEYDLQIQEDLSHGEIQAIDEILTDHSNVEMRLRDGNLEIFETPNEEEA